MRRSAGARGKDLAAELGAAALLAVESDPAVVAAPPDPAVEEGFFRPLERLAAADPALVRVSTAVADELLAAAALDTARAAGAAPRELPGVTATLRIAASERQLLARNVVGILRGSDPRLRDEALVLGAHFDHLGRVGGVVHPGADDNASGVAGLLEIARAFAASAEPPRRTLVFAFWTGEEEGKLGSGHYVRHPRWPLARTVAYLNFDMIGYPWLAEDVRKLVKERGLPEGDAFLAGLDLRDFVAPGLSPGTPAVEAALRSAAAATGLAVYLDFTDGLQRRQRLPGLRARRRAVRPLRRQLRPELPPEHRHTGAARRRHRRALRTPRLRDRLGARRLRLAQGWGAGGRTSRRATS